MKNHRKKHHYSGPNSVKFWKRIANIEDESDYASAYSLGVVLQNIEEYVLNQVKLFESSK
jgi:hypothetical protein